MDEHEVSWHPSQDEVASIRAELRPLLTQWARRDAAVLTAEAWRQRGLSEI